MVAKATIVHGRFVQSHVTGHLLVKSSLPRCLYLHIARHMIMAAKNNFNALQKARKICHSVSRNAGLKAASPPHGRQLIPYCFPVWAHRTMGRRPAILVPSCFCTVNTPWARKTKGRPDPEGCHRLAENSSPVLAHRRKGGLAGLILPAHRMDRIYIYVMCNVHCTWVCLAAKIIPTSAALRVSQDQYQQY